jgi:hypothetical protein
MNVIDWRWMASYSSILIDWTFLTREARGDVADLFAFVAHPLKIGDRLDDGDDQAQVTGGGITSSEDARALLVNRDFHLVHFEVVTRHGFTEQAIALDHGRDRLGELLLDESTHREHLAANTLQVFVEAARNMMREIRRFHGDTPNTWDDSIF